MRYSFENCPINDGLKKSGGNFFVMLFVGRTGSTFVLDVLNQHPQIKFEGEWLETFKNKPESTRLQTEWIRDLFSPADTATCQAIGFKTKFYDIPDKAAFVDSLNEFQPTILVSHRKNIIKQAISAVRIDHFADLKRQKESSETWKAGHTANEVWNIYKEGDGVGKIELDVQKIHYYVLTIEKSMNKLEAFVDTLDLDIIHYDYKDIIGKPERFFDKMFQLFGVDPIPYKVNVFKHTPDELSEAMKNLDELQDFYAGTQYETFLQAT